MITKTPGVYIQENNTLPASIAGVSTAVPLFIGFTEYAQPWPQGQNQLGSKPVRITNMFEFESIFGRGYKPNFTVDVTTNKVAPDKRFFLYETLSLYFRNGGGPCHIIGSNLSDTYDSVTAATNFKDFFTDRISLIDKLDEVTLVLIPDLHFQYKDSNDDLVSLDDSLVYQTVIGQLINKCGEEKDKFALLDFHKPTNTASEIRNLITPDSNKLKFGAVYYPWLKNASNSSLKFNQVNLDNNSGSSIETDLLKVVADINALETVFDGYQSLENLQATFNSLSSDVSTKPKLTEVFTFLYNLVNGLDSTLVLSDSQIDLVRNELITNVTFTDEVKKLFWFTHILGEGTSGLLSAGFPTGGVVPNATWIDQVFTQYTDYVSLIGDSNNLGYTVPTSNDFVINNLKNGQWVNLSIIFNGIASLFDIASLRMTALESQLFATDPIYSKTKIAIQDYMKQIPSQGAIAGIYCKNDRERGVWKSPANMSVQGIESLMVEVSDSIQEGFNVDSNTGKSINVIRTFAGKGPLVWGARTLGGRDNEWKYISVRRFFSFAEKSIKNAMSDFVFEPNNSRTWVKINAMVSSFLIAQWRAGALIGNSADEAFFVRVGKETTSEKEILEGRINVQIGMATARPAEFIILTFSHKLINQ